MIIGRRSKRTRLRSMRHYNGSFHLRLNEQPSRLKDLVFGGSERAIIRMGSGPNLAAERQREGDAMTNDWQPIETAPKDGTPIQARIPGHGSDNIIAWFDGILDAAGEDCGGWQFVTDQEPPDDWTDGVCWAVNESGAASTLPMEWKWPPQTEGVK